MRASQWIGIVMVAMVAGSAGVAAGPEQQEERRSVDGLVYDLQHPEADRRIRAARLLGQNKVHAAVPALMDAAIDRDEDVRFEIAKSLVLIHDRRALPTYVLLTRDANPATQEKAVEGIINTYVGDESGFIQGLENVVDFVNPFSDDYNPLMVEPFVEVDPAAVDAVSDLLLSAREELRLDAAVALGILRARAALPAIQDALDTEPATNVKVELIRTIYKIGDPAGGRALVARITDPDKTVHDEAIFTAGRLRVGEAVPDLVQMLEAGVEERRTLFGFVPISGSDDLSRRVLEALAHIGDARAEQVFLMSLDSQRDWSRQFAAEGLGRIGDTANLPEIARRYAEEESASARLALSFARYRLGEAEYLRDLIDQIDGDQAHAYLLEFGPQEIPHLYPYIRTEGNDVKIRLLDVVGHRGDPSSIGIAQEMIQAGDQDVREAANLAALRIRGRHPGA
ncbi:MAG: HEAT repeat domain-containing protein [Vicinamibacterales bacterium]|jgi:HEAT repeat protein|nr:hypothetical protein [Acidobacteriota bacterium]MDP6371790.1 HEAT repeat domain-containing protein [Vicinamibacterales bacterium]MDP6610339.1 HEAT repeat domain-containing protein [Vicinamibacterales bacterium]HAK55972.1 hypothetical protein [Acidobacteriota bacterium]|tara:strand:- start:4164 stop:5525 length:1362 start_codon:yes stop_codon:yes gene_type:complete